MAVIEGPPLLRNFGNRFAFDVKAIATAGDVRLFTADDWLAVGSNAKDLATEAEGFQANPQSTSRSDDVRYDASPSIVQMATITNGLND